MNFAWDDDDARFRAELSALLDDALPEWWDLGVHTTTAGAAVAEWCRGFAEDLAAKGYLTPHWPRQHGGRDASPWQHLILSEEMWRRGEPRGSQYMNVNWIGPAIMLHGSEAQQADYLPAIAEGRIRWCQGFSEPDAGSDLAALRTLAIRDGEDYVVNGVKVWTSYAEDADVCFLVVRTDPDSRGRDGISVLLVPTSAPGLSIRPIEGVIGEHAFSEVALVDVRVPVSARLGPEHHGWAVVSDALAFERVGAPRYARALRVLDALAEDLRGQGRLDDPLVQRRLGEAVAACEAARVLTYRVVDERVRGLPPSVLSNVVRVASTRADRLTAEVCLELQGSEGLLSGALADARFAEAAPATVAAGTTEVQLNVLARRSLGLPGERR